MPCIGSLRLAGAVTSCKDEPDAYEIQGGKPTINFIRPVSVEAKDSIITAASMRSTVCVVGENLRSVTALFFNDQPAVLNTSYMTDHTLIVTVPNEIPDLVTDKIYFVTQSKDTVAYDFHVIIPAPVVSSMSNEWAAAGEEVTIVGDYFLDYEEFPLTVNFGDYVLPRSAIKSITKNRITFVMPEGVPHEKVSVESIYGETQGAFKYMDNRGMLFDFDTPWKDGAPVLGNHGWHARTITSDGTSLSGNYLILGEAAMGDDGRRLYGVQFHPEVTHTEYGGVILRNFLFAICGCAGNWSGSVQQITNGAAGVKDIYGNTLGGANNTFFHEQGKLNRALYMPWKDNDDKLYHTDGKWTTVTIPFSDFTMDYDGNKIDVFFTSTADFGSFNIFIIRGGYDDKSALPVGVACNPIIKIDNIRVVPNK